jgi:drug/metabolite transporter (DMT)-like permease
MCFGAAVCYGIAIPYQRRFLTGRAGSAVAIPAGQLLVATAALLVVTPFVAGAPPAATDLSLAVVGSVLALGVLGTGLAFVLNFRVIEVAGASASASVTYLLPVVATVLGVLVLDERLSWHQPVGALVILVGVAVSQGVLRRPRAGRRLVSGHAPELTAAAPDPVAEPVATRRVAPTRGEVRRRAAR